MRIVAAVFADFAEAPQGGPSQLRTPLAGTPLLVHTLRRVARIEGLAGRCLVVRARDRDPAGAALEQAGVTDQIDLVADDPGVRPQAALMQTARKWSLEAWRGNPLGMTWFDEYVDVRAAAMIVNRYHCDGVLCYDGHQPLLDPTIADGMLRHIAEYEHEAKYVFTMAPPGLAGLLLMRSQFEQLLQLRIPVGLLLSYRPEIPLPNPVVLSTCYHIPRGISQNPARLTGDTRRSRELIEEVMAAHGPDVDAETVGRWLAEPGHDRAGSLPVEVELELTTDHPLPQSTLRPPDIPRRELTDLDAIRRFAEELAAYDDRLVVLGGHGDPLRHPQFGAVCRILRESGVCGIGVETPLLDLTDEVHDALFSVPVDVVNVHLDAHSLETYQRVHSHDGYELTLANIERIEATRRKGNPQPIVTSCMTRCEATINEMEGFYDDWIRNVGTAVLRGYNDYCGRLPADGLIPTWPPLRGPCRRLDSRLMLLADGTVPQCSQDYRGEVSLGDWRMEGLRELWAGPGLTALRRAHEAMELGAFPLCERCTEWFRP